MPLLACVHEADDARMQRPTGALAPQVCTASIVGFGAAGNFGQAVAARFMGGFFNGITVRARLPVQKANAHACSNNLRIALGSRTDAPHSLSAGCTT